MNLKLLINSLDIELEAIEFLQNNKYPTNSVETNPRKIFYLYLLNRIISIMWEKQCGIKNEK